MEARLRKIVIQNEDDFNKIAEYNRNNRLGTEKISGEDVDIYLMGTDRGSPRHRDLHFVKRKAKESTGPTLLALDRAMQSKTARLEILERRIKVVEAVAKERINEVLEATNEKIKKVEADAKKKWEKQDEYDRERGEDDDEIEKEWKQKEEEYKIIIALQESKIEEMAKTQKQLIEKMEKLEERMINVEFPPIAPKIVNPFDLFIKTN